ncbi:MAG: UDP-N-acetylmuramoyl-L-alanine--D-glutamate ligase [Clostridiales bacterium]|nr:UDP-N-acetylmuramoyl-L-alanine--D-glutamate ligase [Clostridiales bacterium]
MGKGAAIRQEAFKEYGGQTVLVVGAARSGLAAARLLLFIGAKVILNDIKPRDRFELDDELLQHPNCVMRFDQAAEPLLKDCDKLLISPGISVDAPFVRKALQMGIPMIGELDFAAACTGLDIIAISGTNGKTTTVTLVGEMLKKAGHVVHVAGNIGYPLSAAVLNAEENDLLLTEVSSFQMETSKHFHPRVAALLNITPDHLDRHKTMDGYVGLKKRLFANMGQFDTIVLNYDDERLQEISADLVSKTIWFSYLNNAPEGAVLLDGEIAWREQGDIRPICMAKDLLIPGAHNVENALAATAIAHQMEVPFPVIAYTLKTFKGVEHRIEYVTTVNGVLWLNDSKGTNPDSTIKAIDAMAAPTVLIAGGYDKEISFRDMAEAIVNAGNISCCVLMGQTAQKIGQDLKAAGFTAFHYAHSLNEAVHLSAALAKEGGNVLFSPACASFDMFDDYEHRGREFKRLVHQRKAEEG